MPEFPAIKDIAAPVEPGTYAGLAWGWWVAAALLALVLLTLLGLWLRTAMRRPRLPALPGRPEKIALGELESLRQQAGSLSAEEFATCLSGIVRTFLQRQTGVLALYATSPEILGDRPRAGDPPPPPAIAAFRDTLLASDELKYGAPRADRSSQIHGLIDSAMEAVRLAALPPQPEATAVSPPSGTSGKAESII